MEIKEAKNETLSLALGVSDERFSDLLDLCIETYMKSNDIAEVLKKLVINMDLSTSDLVLCTYTIGKLSGWEKERLERFVNHHYLGQIARQIKNGVK